MGLKIAPFKEKYRVTELQHAFRINGVVDVYKEGCNLYDIVTNRQHRFYDDAERDAFAFKLLEAYPPQDDFKKTSKGRMSYQEFKNIKKREEYDYNATRAEDYHWKFNADKTSEDHLYFLVHDGSVKIGRSANPHKRFNQLKTALSSESKMYYFKNKGFMETILHKCFSDIRKHGEWFQMCLRVKHFIDKYHNGRNVVTRQQKDNKAAA